MRTSLILSVFFSFILLCGCSTQGPVDVAGSGTKTGNAMVAGCIRTPDGHTVAGAEVALRDREFLPVGTPGTPSGFGKEYRAQTDSGGNFSFSDVETGLYLMEARRGDSLGIVRDSVAFTASAGKDITLNDTLKAIGGLNGTLEFPDTILPSTITVCLPGYSGLTTPDSNGIFHFDGMSPTQYRMRILVKVDTLVQWDTSGINIPSSRVIQLDTISLVSFWRAMKTTGLPAAYSAGPVASGQWSGAACIAYQRSDNGITVVRFSDTGWAALGGGQASDSIASAPLLTDWNNKLLLTYIDDSREKRLTCRAWDGTQWKTAGSRGFSPAGIKNFSAACDSSGIWVAFIDSEQSDRVTLMHRDSSQWRVWGKAGFTSGPAHELSLAVIKGALYLAYTDSSQGMKVTVLRLSNTAWQNVGSPTISDGAAGSIQLVEYNGTPTVAFCDSAHATSATVLTYNGNSWQPLGVPGFNRTLTGLVRMAADEKRLVLAYQDNTFMNQVRVCEWNGSEWKMLSISKLPYLPVTALDITLLEGTPWLMVRDMKFINNINALRYVKHLF